MKGKIDGDKDAEGNWETRPRFIEGRKGCWDYHVSRGGMGVSLIMYRGGRVEFVLKDLWEAKKYIYKKKTDLLIP